jgi:hypothetical protein
LFFPDGDRAVDALQARESLKICSGTAAKHWMAASLAKIADIAQWVEREPSKLNVVGSKPSVRSISGVPVSRHLRETEETVWWRVCWQPGFMAPEVQCSGRSRFGFMPAAHMQVQPKWIQFLARVAQSVEQPPCKRQVVRSNRDRGRQGICHVRLAGSGHKAFILVDRGSNPLRDANSSAGSQVVGWQLFSKEAQCSQERSAETGLKDRVAPELVTGDFLEDWPRGSRHSLAKRELVKMGAWHRTPYLPPSLLVISFRHLFSPSV